MPIYGTKFILSFSSTTGEQFQVNFDYLNYSGPATNIVGDDDCITIRETTGDESKFSWINGKECLINIFVDGSIPLTIFDFFATTNNEIRVSVFRLNLTSEILVFQGFVAVDKMSQPFMDPPYVISIRALDGLGLLKGVDLVDLNNQKFYGNFNVIQWLTQVIYKTGTTMPIHVYFNWTNTEFNNTQGVFEQIFLSSHTFSEGDSFNINAADPAVDTAALTADDSYTCLEKLARNFRCKIFQQNGAWKVVNLYEYSNPGGFAYTEYAIQNVDAIPAFDPTATYTAGQRIVFDGIYLSSIAGSSPGPLVPSDWQLDGMVDYTVTKKASSLNYDVNIGKLQLTRPVEGDQIWQGNQPLKWVQLNYSYNQADNKTLNQNLEDVDVTQVPTQTGILTSQDIDPTGNLNNGFTNQGNPIFFNLTYKDFPALGWTGYTNKFTRPLPATTHNAIRVVYDQNNFEYQRFLVISENPASITWLQSDPASIQNMNLISPILIDDGDKFSLSGSFRTKHSIGTGGETNTGIAYVLLFGNDNSRWSLHANPRDEAADPTRWVKSIGTEWDNNVQFVEWQYQNGENYDIWISFSTGTVLPTVPVGGKIVIILASNVVGGLEYWYKDLQITIYPYLSGGITQITGDYNYVTSKNNLSIRSNENDDVEISDSPKRYFKGALLDVNGKTIPPGTPQQTGGWYYIGQNPNVTYRFSEIMSLLLYNNQWYTYSMLQGTFKGLSYLNTASTMEYYTVGLLNNYYFSDFNFPTKRFVMTSSEMHLCTGEMRAVFVEVTQDANDNGYFVPSGNNGFVKFGYTLSNSNSNT